MKSLGSTARFAPIEYLDHVPVLFRMGNERIMCVVSVSYSLVVFHPVLATLLSRGLGQSKA